MRVKLLIVDDEIVQLGLIGRVVARFRPEYEITTTHEPKEALRLLGGEIYDAVLTDIRMPDMDGIELIRSIRGMQIRQPEVMILSGFDDFHYAKTAISFNVLEYLLKPVDSVSLENALGKLEKRLMEKQFFLHIQDSYHVMEKQRITTALFKLASGLELNVQESACVEDFREEKLRLICLEDCRPEDCAGTISDKDYVEALSGEHYLIFQRVCAAVAEDGIKPPEKGHMTVSLPCRIKELSACWKQLDEYADTCRWLKRRLLVQHSCDEQILAKLTKCLMVRQPEEIRAMQLPLATGLRGGGLTRLEVCRTVRTAVCAMQKSGVTFGMYPNRQEELLQLLEERMKQCEGVRELCETAASLFEEEKQTGEEREFARSVSVFLQAHFAEECSLEYISRAFGYSPAHFSRLFTAAFGTTYTRYLSEYRLERASDLLKTTDIPVSEVARQVGIFDSGYFARQFSKKYYTSPAKYRKLFGRR